MKTTALFVLVALAAVSVASAARTIDETVPATAGGEVELELVAGNVKVVGWDRDEVSVTGTVGDEVEDVDISSGGGSVSIEIELEERDEHSMKDISTDLEIRIPRGSSFEVEMVAGELTIEGITGTVEVEAVSVEVTIDGSMREVSVATVSGRVLVKSDEPLREGEFESVSGTIEVRAALDGGGDFSFETVSGNVELYLPSHTSADFDIETFSGKIENQLTSDMPEKESEFLPAQTLSFSLGSGAADVEIESFSGHIKLMPD